MDWNGMRLRVSIPTGKFPVTIEVAGNGSYWHSVSGSGVWMLQEMKNRYIY